MTTTGLTHVYVLHHDKYACIPVPALPLSLFQEAIPELACYQDDEDLPFSRDVHVYSVTRQFPEPVDISGFAECDTWSLPGEAGARFNEIWAANESRA
jgi:hypothetical protein